MQWRKRGRVYPDLITPLRPILERLGVHYVIENTPGAPLANPVFLNGDLFGIRIHRPRWFECSFPVSFGLARSMPAPVKMGRAVTPGDVVQPVGHFSGVDYVRAEMEVPWMTQGEIAQAMLPAYGRFLGSEFKGYMSL